jgi:small nuclear ribonucleoprotein (snRNP)-like protein
MDTDSDTNLTAYLGRKVTLLLVNGKLLRGVLKVAESGTGNIVVGDWRTLITKIDAWAPGYRRRV